MKFNKTLVSLSIMFLLTAVIVSIGFSKARVFDPEMVQQIASAYVPYTSKAAGLEDQTDCYRVHFTDGSTQYIVNVDKVQQSAASVETVYTDNKASKTAGLNENNIHEIIQHATPDAVIHSVALQQEDGLYVYDADYETSTTRVHLKLNAENGNTLRRTVIYPAADAYRR